MQPFRSCSKSPQSLLLSKNIVFAGKKYRVEVRLRPFIVANGMAGPNAERSASCSGSSSSIESRSGLAKLPNSRQENDYLAADANETPQLVTSQTESTAPLASPAWPILRTSENSITTNLFSEQPSFINFVATF